MNEKRERATTMEEDKKPCRALLFNMGNARLNEEEEEGGS